MTTFTSAILQGRVAPQKRIKPAGAVFIIRCVPDIYTNERINIGVCAIDGSTGKRYVKVITEPGRLQCLYGNMATSVVRLARVAAEAALSAASPPSPQILFDEPSPYYHSTAEEVIRNTFADQITVALPVRETPRARVIDDAQALRQVTDAIKLLASDLDFDLIANTPEVLVTTERGQRPMNFPLQPRDGLGCIRSAYYSASTLKTHLMESVLDLECAGRTNKKSHLALFILRPNNLEYAKAQDVDDVIDDVAYRAPTNLIIEAAAQADILARFCNNWASNAQVVH